MAKGPKITGENGGQCAANGEQTHRLQIHLGRIHQIPGCAHGLQNRLRTKNQRGGDHQAHHQIAHQTQPMGLLRHTGPLGADVLGHNRHHARRNNGKHNQKYANIGVGRANGTHRLVTFRRKHQGVHHAREHDKQ